MINKRQGWLLFCTAMTLYAASTDKDFTLKGGKGIILNEPTNSYSTKIKSSDTLEQNIVLTLPPTAPKDGQVLSVNSNGELVWVDNNSSNSSSDNQKIDKFILDGDKIRLSLERDGEVDKVIDLSSLTTFLKADDIVDNLTSTDANKALSAKQGKTLKEIVDALNALLSNHASATNNPHQVTKAQIGLENVDNTSDLDKPISKATQNALDILDTKVSDINTTFDTKLNNLNTKITDINNSQSDNQGVDILDFNSTHLIISLDNNDTNKTVALDRNLSSLKDVNLTGLANGKVLSYDETSKSWIVTSLPDDTTAISDINKTTQTNKQNISDINTSLNARVDEVNSSITTLNTTLSTQDSKIDEVNQTAQANKQKIADVNSTLSGVISATNTNGTL